MVESLPDDTDNARVDELIKDSLDKTVQLPPTDKPQAFGGGGGPFLFWLAQAVDEITPWGQNPKVRDQQLREFITAESIFASSLSIIASRNSAFAWTLEGPDDEVERTQEILHTANFGEGWASLMTRASIDLYTTDSGAWIEIIREEDRPDSPLVGLANLDGLRCYATGHPDVPCVYIDRKNNYHYLKWYQVIHLLEMPSAWEYPPKMQYSALTRVLRAVQTHRDITIYLGEKIGGRNTRAITLLQGVKAIDIMRAQQNEEIVNNERGRLRYTNPIFVEGLDPTAAVDFKTLEIAAIPDGFDLDEQLKWYYAVMALAFLSDYQDFAPLPGTGLGSGMQSEMLHEKSRGKGAALFQKIITHALNWFVLPSSVEFKYVEQDLASEEKQAKNKLNRATARQIRIESGEITPEVARAIALAEKDLTQAQYDLLATQDAQLTPVEESYISEDANLEGVARPTSEETLQEGGTPQSQLETGGILVSDTEAKERRAGPSDSRLAVEELVAQSVDQAFDDLHKELLSKVEENVP